MKWQQKIILIKQKRCPNNKIIFWEKTSPTAINNQSNQRFLNLVFQELVTESCYCFYENQYQHWKKRFCFMEIIASFGQFCYILLMASNLLQQECLFYFHKIITILLLSYPPTLHLYSVWRFRSIKMKVISKQVSSSSCFTNISKFSLLKWSEFQRNTTLQLINCRNRLCSDLRLF